MQDVQDEPLFAERVAGLDIAKAGVEVTIRVPSDTTAGRRQQETRSFGTTRRELESLGDWLRCWGMEGDFVAEAIEAADVVAGLAAGVHALFVVVGAEVGVAGGGVGQQGVDDGQHGVAGGDQGFLLGHAPGQRPERADVAPGPHGWASSSAREGPVATARHRIYPAHSHRPCRRRRQRLNGAEPRPGPAARLRRLISDGHDRPNLGIGTTRRTRASSPRPADAHSPGCRSLRGVPARRNNRAAKSLTGRSARLRRRMTNQISGHSDSAICGHRTG